MFESRLGCSTISFRHLTLHRALDQIGNLGFTEIDLGSLPGVCDHVPLDLTGRAVKDVADAVSKSGLRVRSINCDVGDLNDPATDLSKSSQCVGLLELAATVGATALVLPNGAIGRTPIGDLATDLDRVAANFELVLGCAQGYGVEVWTESLHVFRLCCNSIRAAALTSRLNPSIGIVMDFSHIVASGGNPVRFVEAFGRRITHVHVRDATKGAVDLDGPECIEDPGNINLSVGRGDVDFGAGLTALHSAGFAGHFTLELETRDVTDEHRPSATSAAGHVITTLLNRSTTEKISTTEKMETS
ncbi:MAG: sugar phosphate isomerase/epimerase [Rhodococcus sp. (in: high G+C Gram-positive bacteria)]|jgi:sugar phosphate isomerase/epimerase|uniref:sugar phosphate isomerase/epimerase family protein n=1 Tax=Nocardiaceae TaxID=85025 RepID=UPI001E3A4611|nr:MULTISPECIES: sugar phosphate isomerase/epimerase [Rhodococcus]MCC8926940.1 sugar phosphate isomerase/epimerase [Rhodococcus sp. I2R]MCZ4278817.1 sugar phosphate isomerase/epimerase [Rhodococcus yunnanensis]